MFRARRMRDEMTISLIGPLPRSHSPACWVRSLSFIKSTPPDRPSVHKHDDAGAPVFSCQLSTIRLTAAIWLERRNLTGLGLPDQVTELGGAFVIFGLDGALQFLSQLAGVDLPAL